MAFSITTSIYLFLGGLLGGFIDSIAGGGGLISIPILLSVGIPPHQAIATNKFQSSFGSFSASVNYSLKGFVDFKIAIFGIIYTLFGSIIGSITVQMISTEFLNYFIPIFLLIIFIYFILSPQAGSEDKKSLVDQRSFFALAGFILGFYDGFFGPGTGSFWAMAFVFFLGYNLKKATGYTKVMNFTSNIVSLIVFIIGNQVFYQAGIIMGTGQIIGAITGSKMVIIKEIKFIRYCLLIIVGLTIINLLRIHYN